MIHSVLVLQMHEEFMPATDFKMWDAELQARIGKLNEAVFLDSPLAIVAIEHFRRLARLLHDPGPFVPVDKFVFAKGEPPARHMTKVNGLPYRPADRPWPYDTDRNPLAFLMQFCFVESRDHMYHLPGDVLLVFVRTMIAPIFKTVASRLESDEFDRDTLHFEWYRLGVHNLVQAGDVPRTGFEFPTCFGVYHRSCDYTNEEMATSAIGGVLPEALMPIFRLRAPTTRAFCQFAKTKIGGKPYWYLSRRDVPRGQFLGSFGGVQLADNVPYPWANQREPISGRVSVDDEHMLIFRDSGGIINFFLAEDSTIDWYVDFGTSAPPPW